MRSTGEVQRGEGRRCGRGPWQRAPESPTATSPIAATEITIEVPSVTGRVQSVSGDTVTLVTGNGQLEYVTLSSSTAYHGLRGASAAVSSIKAGVYIVAQGTQVSLTTLNADDVQVLGTLSLTPHGFPVTPGQCRCRPSRQRRQVRLAGATASASMRAPA